MEGLNPRQACFLVSLALFTACTPLDQSPTSNVMSTEQMSPNGVLMQQIINAHVYIHSTTGELIGTGAFVQLEDGRISISTARHVIDEDTELIIRFGQEKAFVVSSEQFEKTSPEVEFDEGLDAKVSYFLDADQTQQVLSAGISPLIPFPSIALLPEYVGLLRQGKFITFKVIEIEDSGWVRVRPVNPEETGDIVMRGASGSPMVPGEMVNGIFVPSAAASMGVLSGRVGGFSCMDLTKPCPGRNDVFFILNNSEFNY